MSKDSQNAPSSNAKSPNNGGTLGDYGMAVVLGLARAMVMVATTQPPFNIKTIQQTEGIAFGPAFDLMRKNMQKDGFFNSAYRGAGVSLLKMGFSSSITTPMILLASDLLKNTEFQKSNPIAATMCKSLIVAAGKTVTNPLDAVLTRMIKENKSTTQVLKDHVLGKGFKMGAANLFRGATAEAIKNFISAGGTFALKKITEKSSSELSPLDKTLASAAILAATVTISHPFDTVARKMQVSGNGQGSLTIGQTLKEMSDLSRRSSNSVLRQYFLGLLPKAAATTIGMACNVAALHLVEEYRSQSRNNSEEGRGR